MKKYNDTYYLINTFGKEIFLPDIKKRIPYNEFEYEIFALSADLFDESQDVKQCIRAKMIQDVTDQVLAKLASSSEEVVKEPLVEQETKKASLTNPQTIKPSNKNKEELYIVSDLDSSRALSGGDREERIRNLEGRSRTGKKHSVLVDEYETEDLMRKAKEKRESFIVEGESRANPTIDPRFNLNNKKQTINIDDLNIEVSPEALQKKNEYLDRQAKYVRQNSDYWKNSAIGRERMAKQQAEIESKKQLQKKTASEYKESNLVPDVNPLFSEDFESKLIADTIDPNDTFNPLLHDILAEDAIEEVDTVLTKKSSSKKNNVKSSKKTTKSKEDKETSKKNTSSKKKAQKK